MKRQMMLRSESTRGPLTSFPPPSKLLSWLLTSHHWIFSLNSPITFSPSLSLNMTFGQCLAWMTKAILLIVFPHLSFMTMETLGFSDGSSLLPLLAPLPNNHNGFLRMLPTLNFFLSLPQSIHLSLSFYIYRAPTMCQAHGCY